MQLISSVQCTILHSALQCTKMYSFTVYTTAQLYSVHCTGLYSIIKHSFKVSNAAHQYQAQGFTVYTTGLPCRIQYCTTLQCWLLHKDLQCWLLHKALQCRLLHKTLQCRLLHYLTQLFPPNYFFFFLSTLHCSTPGVANLPLNLVQMIEPFQKPIGSLVNTPGRSQGLLYQHLRN